MNPTLRRLLAATLVLCLVAPVMGCAAKVAPPPPKPQAEGRVLLPPPEAKPGEAGLPKSISKRPPAPAPAPPAPHKIPAPVEATPLEAAPPPGAAPTAPAPAPERIAVGLLLPLTGPEADIGQSILDAAQMALFDTADENFVLLPRDTGGTPEGAARAVRDALSGGAKLILGPLLAQDVAAVAPEARAAHVPVVAFSTDSSVAGDGVYLMGSLPRARQRLWAARRGGADRGREPRRRCRDAS
jgi:hypothetical protein